MFPLDMFSRTWGTKPGIGKWKVMTWRCSQWDADALCDTNHDDSNYKLVLKLFMKSYEADLQWFPSTKAGSPSTVTQWHTLHHAKPSLQPGKGLKPTDLGVPWSAYNPYDDKFLPQMKWNHANPVSLSMKSSGTACKVVNYVASCCIHRCEYCRYCDSCVWFLRLWQI